MQARKLWGVGVFAVAMAYVESAVVVYLREAFDIVDVVRDAVPLPGVYGPVELGRELATIVMLLSMGWLAGRALQDRLGFAVFAFGVWDIAYYFWLWVFIGWPSSLLEWDVLFLIPLPWWVLMILAPRATITHRLTRTYAIFLVLAILYVIFLGLGISQQPAESDFGFGFEQIRQSLSNPPWLLLSTETMRDNPKKI